MTSRAIALTIGVRRPDLALEIPASEDSLPLVRQALRSLGESVGAEPEALEDAELAVTEACANAIEHAYEEDGGGVWVRLQPDHSSLEVSVTDHGIGIAEIVQRRDGTPGFGLEMIRDIATSMEFAPGDGTDLRMRFAIGGATDGGPWTEPSERILRRLVAVVAAQRDMTSERVVEALLLAELVARTTVGHLVGETTEARIDHAGDGLELTVGPLRRGGGEAVVAESDVPVVGPVVSKLANEVRVQTEEAGEYLALRVDPR